MSTTPPRPKSVAQTAKNGFCHYKLDDIRGLLRLSGSEVAHFLDGLLPAKILGARDHPDQVIYTAFLTAQGRILVDVYIYPPNLTQVNDEWWLECDKESVPILFKHLKKHKLRTKFKLETMQPEQAYVIYQTGPAIPSASGILASGADGRLPGHRYIVTGDNTLSSTLTSHDIPLDARPHQYQILRILHGMAEGQKELISEHSLPQESNIDLVNGIDFHKGCYLGQELTIRTHHTGVVRKRILPVQLYTAPQDFADQSAPHPGPWDESCTPPPGANLSKVSTRKGRSTGKLLDSVGNVGLALCRLEMMTDIQLTADATNYNPEEEYQVTWQDGGGTGEERSVKVRPFVPEWVRGGIEANLKRKERRPPRREAGGEEDVD